MALYTWQCIFARKKNVFWKCSSACAVLIHWTCRCTECMYNKEANQAVSRWIKRTMSRWLKFFLRTGPPSASVTVNEPAYISLSNKPSQFLTATYHLSDSWCNLLTLVSLGLGAASILMIEPIPDVSSCLLAISSPPWPSLGAGRSDTSRLP